MYVLLCTWVVWEGRVDGGCGCWEVKKSDRVGVVVGVNLSEPVKMLEWLKLPELSE